MRIFDRLKRDKKNRRFGAWQVEITTRCNLRCTMCIKTVGKHHHHQDMTIHDFEKIVPYFHEVKNVVLEGWGESLLHKNLVDFIRLAKTAGPEVGFVTSGMGLSAEYATQIIGAGVDFIGFSLSGATSKTHNAIRVNSDFEPIIGAIKTVKRLSLENPAERPKLHIVYLMLKDNVHEIPDLLDLANEIGINEIVLLNIFDARMVALQGGSRTEQHQAYLRGMATAFIMWRVGEYGEAASGAAGHIVAEVTDSTYAGYVTYYATQTMIAGTAGGISAEIQGGDFKEGFLSAAAFSIANSLYQFMEEKTDEYALRRNENMKKDIFGRWRTDGGSGCDGDIAAVCKDWSPIAMDREGARHSYDHVPIVAAGVNSISKVHDFFNMWRYSASSGKFIGYGAGFWGQFGNTAFQVYSLAGMPVAAAFTIGQGLGAHGSSLL